MWNRKERGQTKAQFQAAVLSCKETLGCKSRSKSLSWLKVGMLSLHNPALVRQWLRDSCGVGKWEQTLKTSSSERQQAKILQPQQPPEESHRCVLLKVNRQKIRILKTIKGIPRDFTGTNVAYSICHGGKT